MWRLLVALCVGVGGGAKVQVGLKRHQKPRTPVLRDEAVTGSTSAGTFDQQVSSQHNLEYKGVISVGTPPQLFEVIFDTGSDLLWLPAEGCTSSGISAQFCATNTSLYVPRLSSTSLALHQPFSIVYGTGSARGEYYDDVLSFGDAQTGAAAAVGNVTLGAASRLTFSDQGILGLSLPVAGHPTPVFALAAERGRFDRPVFTVHLRRCARDCADGGSLTFGGLDEQHCAPAAGEVAALPGVPYWMFVLDEVRAAGTRIAGQTKAIVDTGTSIIAGPTRLAARLAAALGGRANAAGVFMVECGAQFALSFRINGVEYGVAADQLVLHVNDNTNNNNDYNNGYNNDYNNNNNNDYNNDNNDNQLCQLAVQGDSQLDFWILGDPFLRQWCTVHDVSRRTVAFAASNDATPVNVTDQGGAGSGTPDNANNNNNNGNGGDNNNNNPNNNGNGNNNNNPNNNNNNGDNGNHRHGHNRGKTNRHGHGHHHPGCGFPFVNPFGQGGASGFPSGGGPFGFPDPFAPPSANSMGPFGAANPFAANTPFGGFGGFDFYRQPMPFARPQW